METPMETPVEIIRNSANPAPVQAVVLDFDGTISTLRAGWEDVMEPLMLSLIAGESEPTESLVREVRSYIADSTGIQTAFQMQWLKARVDAAGHGDPAHDIWWYKDLYNQRLLAMIAGRIASLESGQASSDAFLVPGSIPFLQALRAQGVAVYIASGTDDCDLQREMRILGIAPLVTLAKGAPHQQLHCSKEDVVQSLLADIPGERVAVIGDGKVEIRIGCQAGARTIGLATDELRGCGGIDQRKRHRLLAAGADAIAPNFEPLAPLLQFLGLEVI